MSFICIPVRMNLIKAHGGKGSGLFSFERLATSPPQADHVLVDLFFIHGGWGGCVKAPPHPTSGTWNRDLRIFGSCMDQRLRVTIAMDGGAAVKPPDKEQWLLVADCICLSSTLFYTVLSHNDSGFVLSPPLLPPLFPTCITA